ncbi:hypothetical protein LA080_004206 [Diaporthe eres]|nr:hypothetical protein LA080_004206 [Diaporthe eres]
MGISPSKNAQVAATPNNPSPLRDLQDFLLQPPPDKSIRQSWTVLQGMIESHVDSFYNTGPVQVNPAALANNIYQSSSIFATQREAERLAGLLCSESLRKLGIQKYIATILLADIDFFGDPSKTALDKGALSSYKDRKEIWSKRREKLHLIQEARVFSTATEPPPIASLSSVSLGKTATRRATNDPSKTDDSSATHALEPEGSHNERRGSYSKSFSRRSTYDRNLRRNGREDRLPDPGNGLRVSRRNDASR